MTSPIVPLIDDLNIIHAVTLPVSIWFTVPGCPPCKAIEPRVHKLIEKHGDEFKIYQLDITKNPGAAQELEVMSTPTFIYFKGGVEKGRLDAFPDMSEFEEMLDTVVTGGETGGGEKD